MTIQPSPADTARITKHFSALLGSHGFSAKSLDWGSRGSQETRFAILAAIGDLQGASILDVGCGLADLHGWLLAQGVAHRYTGIDITPAMAEKAAARFPDITIHQGDALTDIQFAAASFDYVFASGVFYLRQEAPMAYLQATVAKLYTWCRQGVAFNSLSLWSPRRQRQEFHADPLEVVASCRTLTSRLALRHDYHPGDFTVHLYRGDPK